MNGAQADAVGAYSLCQWAAGGGTGIDPIADIGFDLTDGGADVVVTLTDDSPEVIVRVYDAGDDSLVGEGIINDGTPGLNTITVGFTPVDGHSYYIIGEAIGYTGHTTGDETFYSLLDDIVHHWKLDETSGNRTDLVGSATLSEPDGAVGYAAGLLGNAADFTRTCRLYNSGAGEIGSSVPWTVAFWFYLDDTNRNNLICHRHPANATLPYIVYQMIADTDSGDYKINLAVVGGGAVTGLWSVPLTSGFWYLAIWSFDHGTGNLSFTVLRSDQAFVIDATTTTTAVHSRTWLNVPANIPIQMGGNGLEALGYWLNGKLDSVSEWHRVLPEGALQRLFNSGAGLEYPFS